MEAFKGGGAYEARYQVALIAENAALVEASERAFISLRDMRNLVEGGTLRDAVAYKEVKEKWEADFSHLREEMRKDLASMRVTLTSISTTT